MAIRSTDDYTSYVRIVFVLQIDYTSYTILFFASNNHTEVTLLDHICMLHISIKFNFWLCLCLRELTPKTHSSLHVQIYHPHITYAMHSLTLQASQI